MSVLKDPGAYIAAAFAVIIVLIGYLYVEGNEELSILIALGVVAFYLIRRYSIDVTVKKKKPAKKK